MLAGDANDDMDSYVVEQTTNIKNESTKDDESESTLSLASIDVSGIDGELKKKIVLHMPVTIPECTADRAEVKQFFTAVKKNIRKAMRALGYYDAQLTSGGSVVDNCWKLRLKIKPGTQTKVTSILTQVIGEGKNEKLFTDILKKPPYSKGDVLNHQKYTDFKAQLSEAAQTLGYYDATFEQHSIKVDPLAYRASIVLILNTGKRYRYGDITVDQKLLSEKAMAKYILLKKGNFFNAEDLINQQQLLQRSGYFSLIKVDVLNEEAKDYQLPVVITLTPKKRNAYKFKVGYGSDTGARIAAEMNRRYLGKSGKQFKIKAQYAEKLPEFSIQLLNPRNNPDDNSLIYHIDLKKDSNNDIDSHSLSIGATLVRKFENGWVRRASLNAIKDRISVDGENETDAQLLMFSVGLEKIMADSLLYPKNGWRLKLSLDSAFKTVLSNQDVIRLEAQAKGIKKLGSGRVLSRINLGTSRVSDFNRLPKNLRFFAGGNTSVRGYAFEGLGERNKNNKLIGGKHLLDLSLEYQHPINDSWSAAVFVDAGNAFNNWNSADLKIGTGLGVRWRSPVGPVRIDVGFPKDNFSDPRLHLSVGSDL